MPVDPSPSMLERIFGPKKRKKDIELPNESGKIDKRLEKPDMLEVFRKMRKGYEKVKGM